MKIKGLNSGIKLGKSFLNNRISLFDSLRRTSIRNTEYDNTIVGTQWLVTANDPFVTQTLTVDRPLPRELREAGSTLSTIWIGIKSSDPGTQIDIASVDFDTNTIYYNVTDNASFIVGDVIEFFNPYRDFELLKYTEDLLPLTASFTTVYAYPGPCWKHSDGTYRLIVMGFDGGTWTVGLASSPDFVTWTYLNSGNYMYVAGTTPFDKAWINLHLFIDGSAIKIPGTNYYAAQLKAYDGTFNQMAVVVFDEDFNIINVPDDHITIPGLPTPQNYHVQFGSLEYFNGTFWASTCMRKVPNDRPNDQIYTFQINNIYTGSVSNVKLVQDGTLTNSWSSQTVEYTTLLNYNDQLYLFVSGEGDYGGTSGGISYGNRQWGMYKLRGRSWELVKDYSPILLNPVNSYTIYTHYLGINLYWAYDHVGAQLSFLKDRGYLYMPIIYKGDVYTSAGLKLKIPIN